MGEELAPRACLRLGKEAWQHKAREVADAS